MGKAGWWTFQSLAYPSETRHVANPETTEFPSLLHKLAFMRSIIHEYSEGPPSTVIREYVASVLDDYGVAPRDQESTAAALLADVQGIRYLAEKHETFTTPEYTLSKRYGDCDDKVLALGAELESVGIPIRMVVLGWLGEWKHVYLQCLLGGVWTDCETILDVPLGSDPALYAEEKYGTVKKYVEPVKV